MVDLLYEVLRWLTGLVGLELVFINMWQAIRDFLELGGDVLLFIALLMCVMWIMIIERIIYFTTRHKQVAQQALDEWTARKEHRSWYAHRIRERLISDVRLSATRSVDLIQTCVALCPLLGLLGTVTGMVKVFEVMALLGTGNPRAMAAGVSQATIPTMSGMVAAISGLFFAVWLKRKADAEVEAVSEHMTMER